MTNSATSPPFLIKKLGNEYPPNALLADLMPECNTLNERLGREHRANAGRLLTPNRAHASRQRSKHSLLTARGATEGDLEKQV
jgi:hypothetical protein